MSGQIKRAQFTLPPRLKTLLMDFVDRTQRLTPAEWAIFQLYIEGRTLEQVAADTGISLNTAKKHNTNINRKLEVTNREELQLYIEVFRCCERVELLQIRGR